MISDFDDAYSNMAYIPEGAGYPVMWEAKAKAFRESLPQGFSAQLNVSYGSRPRQKFDLFTPERRPEGIAIFVHGGYWMRFSKDDWSHLANGALQRGWAVALPGYSLTPDVRLTDIVLEISLAIAAIADRIEGPIHLAGHSAGAHLVCRQICADSSLQPSIMNRIKSVLSISGLFDLRPLLRTKMNETLRLDEPEAQAQSPALLRPLPGIPITCWVGSDERPEFLRQNDLLANIWHGLGVEVYNHHAAGRHHFDVIDDLYKPGSKLLDAWVM